MSTPTYQLMNSLEEIMFIGGSEYTINIGVYDENEIPIDIGSATCSWTMAYYGQPDTAILTKSGTITGLNTFKILLSGADTISLSGKFVHQPIIVDYNGSIFRPAQGIITIIPRIKNT